MIGLIGTSCSTPGIKKESTVKYYRKIIPGVPLGDVVLGGIYEETKPEVPECNHPTMKKVAAESASNWNMLAFWSSILAGIALIVWYLTKISNIAGVAVLLVLYSLFCTMMACVVSIIWLVVIVLIGVGLIGIGIWLNGKTIRNVLKRKKPRKKRGSKKR